MTLDDDPRFSNRIVFARSVQGTELVRYDRSGHWFMEFVRPSLPTTHRYKVNLKNAVKEALFIADNGGEVFEAKLGGRSFYAAYARASDSPIVGALPDPAVGGEKQNT